MEGIGQLKGDKPIPDVDIFHENEHVNITDYFDEPQDVIIRPLDAIRDSGPFTFE